jgi:hypothetical protein
MLTGERIKTVGAYKRMAEESFSAEPSRIEYIDPEPRDAVYYIGWLIRDLKARINGLGKKTKEPVS